MLLVLVLLALWICRLFVVGVWFRLCCLVLLVFVFVCFVIWITFGCLI